jgi:uncharacterized membrane protein
MMVVYALVAMMCFSVRVLISKKTCHAIGTPLYVEINFLTEFCLGLGMLVLWWQGALKLQFETNRTVMLALASFFQVFAEFFLFLGLAVGIVGCVVAVVSSNFVYVSIVSTILGHSSMNSIQIVGATCSLIGVLTVTIGDLVVARFIKGSPSAAESSSEKSDKKSVELTTKQTILL